MIKTNKLTKLGIGSGALVLALAVLSVPTASAALTLSALTVVSDGALTLNSTGAVALTIAPATAAGTMVIGATDGTGVITLGSSSGAQTTNIGTGAGVSTINIGTGVAANVITIGATASTIALSGDVSTAGPLAFTGTYTDSAIDLTSVTLNYGGSSGPVMIRAGTYAAPVTSADSGQSGMIRLYGENTATSDSESSGYYDRGIFVSLQTTGTKGMFPIAGLAEVRESGATAGPKAVQAAQFISGLHTATSKLATRGGDTTAGMYGIWSKVYSATGSVAASGSRVASLWLDNSMGGTVSGEHYSAFITSGGAAKPDAVFGFETGAGWDALFYFDETAYDQDPVVAGDASAGAKDYHLKVNIDGTMYGIQLYAL